MKFLATPLVSLAGWVSPSDTTCTFSRSYKYWVVADSKIQIWCRRHDISIFVRPPLLPVLAVFWPGSRASTWSSESEHAGYHVVIFCCVKQEVVDEMTSQTTVVRLRDRNTTSGVPVPAAFRRSVRLAPHCEGDGLGDLLIIEISQQWTVVGQV